MKVKYVDVKGIRTRYLEAGTGEPMLLVHGGNFGRHYCANDWDLNIESFAKSFHVIAIDRAGCGFTDNPKNDREYVIGTTVQHAHDFLKILNLTGVHLVGHSRGGYVVSRLALEYPGVVKTLVIVSSSTLAADAPSMPVYAEWNRQARLIEDVRERCRYLVTANSYGSEHITDDFLDLLVEIVTLPKSMEATAKMEAGLALQFVKDLTVKQKETRKWIRAGGIKVPTLIMWGFNDPSAVFDPVGLSALQLIFSSIPGSQMHILNQAGHYCFREQPASFVDVITRFIKLNAKAP